MSDIREPRTYRFENHRGWGNRIGWLNYPNKIEGHLSKKPEIGDFVTCKMQSGKVGVFRVLKIRDFSDPPDQFFCDVEALGYEDELPPIPEEIFQKSLLLN